MMVKITSSDQNAVILTKSLGFKQHDFLTNKMGMVDVFNKYKK